MADTDIKPLADATAGATGALLTTVLLSPVDIAKTRIQANVSSGDGTLATIRQILAADGVAGLYKGLGMKGVETVLRNFLYFYAYEFFKARYHSLGFKPSTIGHTGCGVLAGISNLTVTLPIDTLNVRIQADTRSAAVLTREFLAEGPDCWWRGFGVSSILTLNPALTFSIFDRLKAHVLRIVSASAVDGSGAPPALTAAQAFVLGSASKVIATLLTYPLMRAKSIMQASGAARREGDDSDADEGRRRRRGLVQVLIDVIEREGAAGLYRGCATQIFTAVTKSGILLTTKEQLAAFAMGLVLLLKGRRLTSA